ncbi:efflux RND transporter periplasmic adaptor subunit [Phaeovulum sp.]|uniref:efflux RND transporter periplasmic adaptor subunit n=1 Tax=Phaeovulum sp. TaxID=2934796 RepID=UPI0039E63E43
MRFLMRSLMGLFLVALTLGLLAFAAYTVKSALDARRTAKSRPQAAQERVFSANVVAVTVGRIVPVLTAYGEVQSSRRLELRAASSGTIVEMSPDFAEGAAVEAGQLLLRIDPAEATATRDTQRAALAEAEAALAEAIRGLAIARDDLAAADVQAQLRDQALTRQQSIDARGLGRATDTETAQLAASTAAQAVLNRRSTLSQAEARLDQAQNTLARQQIALSEADRKLTDTELRAEFAGRLSGVTAVKGGLLSNNEKLGELIDPAALEVSFRVSTTQFARLIDPQGALLPVTATVALEVQGTELMARARLTRVGAAVGEGQTGRLLFAQLEAGAAGFRPGDFVTVRLEEPALDQVALVPATAVDAAGQVLVLGPDDRLELAQTQVLRRQGDAVIIRASALAGREIVAERSPLLGMGLKVRPLRSGETGAALTAPEVPAMVALTPERRARLIAYVKGNANMPADAKARVLAQLGQEQVSASVIARLEQRMGG